MIFWLKFWKKKFQDLGCGWGSFGLFVLQNYPKCHVTCVSNSNTQRHHIESEGLRLGVSNRLQCITADANEFTTNKRFDRIVSIEMFEVFFKTNVLFWLRNKQRLKKLVGHMIKFYEAWRASQKDWLYTKQVHFPVNLLTLLLITNI